jgi:hypothetical protein
MSNNNDYILHPNKDLIIKNFFNEKTVEHFFEGPPGYTGESGARGDRGDRGIRGSEGPAGPVGPAGEGLNESDLMARSLWCVTENQCQTPKNIVARFRGDTIIKVGPNTAGNKSLVLGGKNNETGESSIYTAYNNIYIDGANADENSVKPGNIYLSKNSKGNTYINEEGNYTLLNDKSGYVGVNMQGSDPENNLHIKGDRALTIENVDEVSGTAGIMFKDKKSEQNWTIGATNLGFFLKDDNNEKYSLVTKNGSTGIGTDMPNPKFSLDVGGYGRFRKDIRMTGGSDTSLQINMNKNEDDRKDFTGLTQGLELVGGDVRRSKINFYGDNMDIKYGKSDKTLLTFNRNGVEFVGPVNFSDLATFSGPTNPDENPENIAMVVKNNASFEGKTDHKMGSYWGQKGTDDEWAQINNNLFESNNGIRLYSKNNDEKYADFVYDDEKLINNGEEVNGEKITKGAFIIQNNLVVEGSGDGGISGIQTDVLKASKLQADQIRTFNQITFSDARLKEDIKLINPIDNFNKLMKLNGYEYTNKITKKKDKGVIAQQVENISPDLVDNQDRYKGVKYDNIIPMLIEGIKYQQKEINILKSKLK